MVSKDWVLLYIESRNKFIIVSHCKFHLSLYLLKILKLSRITTYFHIIVVEHFHSWYYHTTVLAENRIAFTLAHISKGWLVWMPTPWKSVLNHTCFHLQLLHLISCMVVYSLLQALLATSSTFSCNRLQLGDPGAFIPTQTFLETSIFYIPY